MGKVQTSHDQYKIQKDPEKLEIWNKQWDMDFNDNKCKVMHIGRNNANFEYQLNNQLVKSVEKENDLGSLLAVT